MSTVLVVDDAPYYHDLLIRHLARNGHEVATAATGPEALVMGLRLRPDVLLTDWLLPDHVPALQVASVLRTVAPALHTVLLTDGRHPEGLELSDTRDHCSVIATPCDFDDVLLAVEQASHIPCDFDRSQPVATVERDALGTLWHVQVHPSGVDSDSGGMSLDTMRHLDAITASWLEVLPHTPEPCHWRLRVWCDPERGEQFLAVVPGDIHDPAHDAIIRLLLDIPVSMPIPWLLGTSVLVIDDDTPSRRRLTAHLEHVGGVCHTANSLDAALQTCRRHDALNVVVLTARDATMDSRVLEQAVMRLQALRPTVHLIGTSAADFRQRFAAVGVPRFLPQPWRAEDLSAVLTSHPGAEPFPEIAASH